MIVGHIGGKSTDVGYEIQKSLRFRPSALSYLSRVFGTPTNQNVFTYSCWCKRGALDTLMWLFSRTPSSNSGLMIDSTNKIGLYNANAAYLSSVLLRDVSAHFHVLFALNGTSAKIEINGVLVYSATYTNTQLNVAGGAHYIGVMDLYGGGRYIFDGYLSDIHFIDGQALSSSSFGTNNADGLWVAKKYTGTYGNNGFFLDFSDGTSLTTLGYDKSGNGNHWTLSGHSLTAGANYDWMDDTPTNNFAVLNPLNPLSSGINNGGLTLTVSGVNALSSINLRSADKTYWEYPATGVNYSGWGVALADTPYNYHYGNSNPGMWGIYNTGTMWKWDSVTSSNVGVAPPAIGGTLAGAFDSATGRLWLGYANSGAGSITWIGGGDPEAGTSPFATISGTAPLCACADIINGAGVQTIHVNFGQRPFAYAPPAGFKALCTKNLPAPVIANPRKHFDVALDVGNGATKTITGTQFAPGLVWRKGRNSATYNNHTLYDTVRGVTKLLQSNATAAEATAANSLTAFNTDGFSLGSFEDSNTNNNPYVSWMWKAGGAPVANTDGSITSQVSANQEAGFSIVTYTGTGANATVGHGLGKAPKMIIVKSRGNAKNWPVYHASVGATHGGYLNLTNAFNSAVGLWNNTTPNSTVFSVGGNPNGSWDDVNTVSSHIAYCFTEVEGFSKIGSYVGNGSADGPFVHCGFRPKFVLVKASSSAQSWVVFDGQRNTSNLSNLGLVPNMTLVEFTGVGTSLDLVSNGFKPRGAGAELNITGVTYIFYAIADVPFKYANAR